MEASQCRRHRCIDMLSRSRYISAPMVNQSDPMWRQLVKKYGCDVVYTQMLESDKFVNDANYRREMFLTHSYDHPLIVQFSSNCPITFLLAARLVEPYCEGVELNLGCPQRSARSGIYGAFLLDPSHHRRVVDILTLAHHSQLQVPICAKIRLLPTLDETIRFCKLIAPFIDVLTIHGRTRGFVEERRKGPADLNQVKRVFQALRSVEEEEEVEEDHNLSTSLSRSSPSNQAQIVSSSDQVDHLSHPRRRRRRRLLLWTNGNVRSSSDVEANISYTRADGCMVGEGLLNDPTLFSRCRLRENGDQPNLTQIDLPTIHSTIDHSHQFPGLSLQEFDRRIGIIDEYIHLLQEAGEDQQFRSPFESNQQESSYSYSSPSTGRDHTHLSTIISENEFLTPFVSWSSFHLHLYHILNSDPHARFLYHTQLVDDFLDSTNLTDLTHVCAQVRDRIESNRRFDPTLELVIQQNRPLRQSHRQALKRVKEFESTGFKPPINTRQRKRQRWKQRKEDEKRRKVEPALLDEEKQRKDNPRIDPVPVPASSDS